MLQKYNFLFIIKKTGILRILAKFNEKFLTKNLIPLINREFLSPAYAYIKIKKEKKRKEKKRKELLDGVVVNYVIGLSHFQPMKKEKKGEEPEWKWKNSGKRNTHASPYLTTIPHSLQLPKRYLFFFFFLLMVNTQMAQTLPLTKMSTSFIYL